MGNMIINSWNGKELRGTVANYSSMPTTLAAWGCYSISGSLAWRECLQGSTPKYIKISVYNGLSDADKATARKMCAGCVKDTGTWVYVKKAYNKNWYTWDASTEIPYPIDDPCEGVVCDPECVGVDLYETVCEDGECVRGALKEANNITTCGYVKPMCDEGDKRPGEICRGGDWVPHTPGDIPGEGRLYVKFAIPWLDRLPWLPYEPWMWIPPGFEVVEEQ